MNGIWRNLSKKKALKIIGLMSGTSCDGVTCALSVCRKVGLDISVEVSLVRTYPYAQKLREILLSVDKLAIGDATSLHFYLGRIFGNGIIQFRRDFRDKNELLAVDLIGSHGHTVTHRPPGLLTESGILGTPGTLQIGEAACIAQITGIPVVADFRPGDMAVDGQGAPLVPFFDYIAFRDKSENRLILNLGGIANVTLVTWDREKIFGFDTGPGNAILDYWIEQRTGRRYDKDGELALMGTVQEKILSDMLRDPYFQTAPPKSLDRSYFTSQFIAHYATELLACKLEDALATLCALTADSVYNAVCNFLPVAIDRVLIGGGGVYNAAVKKRLVDRFYPITVDSTLTSGIHPEAKEAGAFALMAACYVWGIPNHIHHATGATKAVILGKMILP